MRDRSKSRRPRSRARQSAYCRVPFRLRSRFENRSTRRTTTDPPGSAIGSRFSLLGWGMGSGGRVPAAAPTDLVLDSAPAPPGRRRSSMHVAPCMAAMKPLMARPQPQRGRKIQYAILSRSGQRRRVTRDAVRRVTRPDPRARHDTHILRRRAVRKEGIAHRAEPAIRVEE